MNLISITGICTITRNKLSVGFSSEIDVPGYLNCEFKTARASDQLEAIVDTHNLEVYVICHDAKSEALDVVCFAEDTCEELMRVTIKGRHYHQAVSDLEATVGVISTDRLMSIIWGVTQLAQIREDNRITAVA
ncbi:hypothetical protein R2R70_02185 [Cobetia sp. SIMBA_158]|uniref:hypothetical protein n=1 Tax=Cobetia sp. SIMBA_158 TaxID=3081617 RepID=UPI00397EA2E3